MGANLTHGALIIIIIIIIIIQETELTDDFTCRSKAVFLNLQKEIVSCELISLLKLLEKQKVSVCHLIQQPPVSSHIFLEGKSHTTGAIAETYKP
jgi:hypothetical protein